MIHEGMAKQIVAMLLQDPTILEEHGASIPEDLLHPHPVLEPILGFLLARYKADEPPLTKDHLLQLWLDYSTQNPATSILKDSGASLVEEVFSLPGEIGAKDILYRAIRQKQLVEMGREILALKPDCELSEISKLKDKFDEVLVGYQQHEDASLGYFFFTEDRDRIYADVGERVCPLGYPSIDTRIDGGLSPGEMFVVTGGRGKGKSLVLGNIAANIVRMRKRVIVVTFEISETRYSERLDAMLLDVPVSDVRAMMLRSKSAKIRSGLEELRQKVLGFAPGIRIHPADEHLIIKELPGRQSTSATLLSYVRKVIKYLWTPDMVLFDYLKLIRALVPRKDRWIEMGDISGEIRGIGQTVKCATGTAAQQKRKAKNTPDQDDTADAIGIFDDPDLGLAIGQTREEYNREGPHRRLRIGIIKNRKGESDTEIPMDQDKQTLRITEGKWQVDESGIKGWDKKEAKG